MKTSDVARMLGLSCSRVRQLTSEGQRPRQLPVAQWHGDRWAGWREYDRAQARSGRVIGRTGSRAAAMWRRNGNGALG